MLSTTHDYLPDDNTPTVLLVEDDQISTLYTKMVLNQLGYHSITAASGEEALEMAKKERYNFILTDLGLPTMSGEKFIQSVREWEKASGKPPIPIIVLTGHGTPAIAQSCFSIGVAQVLIKPLNVTVLQETIKEIFCNKPLV